MNQRHPEVLGLWNQQSTDDFDVFLGSQRLATLVWNAPFVGKLWTEIKKRLQMQYQCDQYSITNLTYQLTFDIVDVLYGLIVLTHPSWDDHHLPSDYLSLPGSQTLFQFVAKSIQVMWNQLVFKFYIWSPTKLIWNNFVEIFGMLFQMLKQMKKHLLKRQEKNLANIPENS